MLCGCVLALKDGDCDGIMLHIEPVVLSWSYTNECTEGLANTSTRVATVSVCPQLSVAATRGTGVCIVTATRADLAVLQL